MGQLYQHTETVQFIFFALHYSKLKSEAKSWTLFKKAKCHAVHVEGGLMLRGRSWCWGGALDIEGATDAEGSTWYLGSNWYWGGALDIEWGLMLKGSSWRWLGFTPLHTKVVWLNSKHWRGNDVWKAISYRLTESIELWHLAYCNHKQCYRVLVCVDNGSCLWIFSAFNLV